MPRPIVKLLGPDQPLTGGLYLLLGLTLFLLKYTIDATLSYILLGRTWSPWNYLAPGASVGVPIQNANTTFYMSMLAISIPFILVGICLTLRRLRSAGLSEWLVILFFIPVINFLFFLIISLQPNRDPQPRATIPFAQLAPHPAAQLAPGAHLEYQRPQRTRFEDLLALAIPKKRLPLALTSIIAPTPPALLMAWLGVEVLTTYGWGLFVGLPFTVGMLAVLIRSFRQPLNFTISLVIGIMAMAIFALSLMAFALEGAICIIMALPIVMPIAILGSWVGYLIQKLYHANIGGTFILLLLFLPLFMGAERATMPDAPVFEVKTSIHINAPPEKVWTNVVSFSQLPAPTEFIFRAGVAYPIRAHIDGQGVGACRYCVFSTGQFEEPITVWDAPRLLKFDVRNYPPPMKEWSPFADIHPPHLDDFLVSKGGQFHLIRLSDGTTQLEGTTWYQHHMWPAGYWRLWSDSILHQIHRRVLNHVKNLSEADHDESRSK